MEKELEENLPLYGSISFIMQGWEQTPMSKLSKEIQGWSIPFRTRMQYRKGCRLQQCRGMRQAW